MKDGPGAPRYRRFGKENTAVLPKRQARTVDLARDTNPRPLPGDEDEPPGAAVSHLPLADETSTSPFVLEKLLAEGGMGQVWRAYDTHLDRHVAVKLIRGAGARDPSFVQRFMRETLITARLEHPNIIPVHALEAAGTGGFRYAMKLIEGVTLRELLDEAAVARAKGMQPQPEYSRGTLLDHFLKICDALTFAHARGVIHRDLKPSNVMIGR